MPKLILMVGLPRSGKSTWAKTTGYPIVNRDSIRLALHGEAYLQKAESLVTIIEDCMVEALILAGHDKIIIDACHTTPKRRERWLNSDKWNIEYKVIPTIATVCLIRAKENNRPELIPIIEHMAKDWDLTGIYTKRED